MIEVIYSTTQVAYEKMKFSTFSRGKEMLSNVGVTEIHDHYVFK